MKFAIVDEGRSTAQPNDRGICLGCGNEVIARCGEKRVWHWAHKSSRECDIWWENETEWHRTWKEHFPEDWQEVVHPDPEGGRHIADVKTNHGWVLEFQHSYLKTDERRARDRFYQKRMWVVDGTRRPTDRRQLEAAWIRGQSFGTNQQIRKVQIANCRLLEEWEESTGLVYFDMGDSDVIVWRVAKSHGSGAYLMGFPRSQFVELHRGVQQEATGAFDRFLQEIPALIAAFEGSPTAQPKDAVRVYVGGYPPRRPTYNSKRPRRL